jgi:NAD(P)-dependent dehydrogenase (short-subunit alcohol dehydrogenase family)
VRGCLGRAISDDAGEGTGGKEKPMDYRDRHVVIAGGTGALGTAVVGALIEAGAFCHVPYLIEQEALHFPLRDHARVTLLPGADLTDEDAVARVFETVPRLWASIHLVGGFAMAPVAKTTKTELMQQIDINLVTAFLCCRAAVNAMVRAGSGGRIVNVATRPALEWRTGAGMAAYTASKAAVAALTVALAEEVLAAGILVNAVAPSTMDTPANRQAMPKADPDAWAKVADVAATIMFLASPENRVTRGGVVPVYGKS